MSGLEVVALDATDDAAYAAWHAAYLAAETHGRGATAHPWTAPEVRVMLLEDATRRWTSALSGVVDGEVVCAGWASGPLLDNRDVVELAVHTVPHARRRGHGSVVLARLEELAREQGRTTLVAQASWPFDAPPDGTSSPGVEFLHARGFTTELVEVQRQAALPVADALLDDLAAQAAPHHAAYTLRSFVGPVPEELLDGWAALSSTLLTEAPLGEMEREPETADPAAVRENEAVIARQGRTKYNTVALDASGTVVAYTDLAVSEHDTTTAFQWGTLVHAAHRGHRLGLAVKVANLRLFQEHRAPGVRTLVTWNAEVNAHMIGVNERLGFRPVERMAELEKLIREQAPAAR